MRSPWVLAGVISLLEKTLYHCDDSPDDGDYLSSELWLEVIEETFERSESCDRLIHGVRSD